MVHPLARRAGPGDPASAASVCTPPGATRYLVSIVTVSVWVRPCESVTVTWNVSLALATFGTLVTRGLGDRGSSIVTAVPAT